ncbi:Protein atp11, mitochondrial [Schizosaccharomyces pombe]|uniref:Protein atp11, mitochondrial n=1 Tax=Schizosaccharomyces pombe (strain 972 / ATCC 24843) TaxID=284812 RepID=ATP11_SCHPO|nr:putative F1-ATPase chaperone Atp11 [Schizosaccharomyces pombe]P87127.1 RecName: Full=Protein atp11, mitochondrial; Flags: Precursor [Schizosaccharomyces pombe 972h-]CAB08757.1 F1-ATPase chaperone Atp11 (predicted) [Schizosaccharomyces pombe]|eukprot:NP_593338.1 putative F1-ATPase chaperone Atp11 [Schizosaccharomyces pombe]
MLPIWKLPVNHLLCHSFKSIPRTSAYAVRFAHHTSNNDDLEVKKNTVYERYERKLKSKAEELHMPVTNLLKKGQTKEREHVIPKKSFSAKKSLVGQNAKKSDLSGLNRYIDVEKIKELPTSTIEKLWRARNIGDDILSACIPKEIYEKMLSRARMYPYFVLPLPRGDKGIESHFLQWNFPNKNEAHLLVTSLLEYKLKGSYAAPHTIMLHFADLLNLKGITLMRCQFEPKKLSANDVQLLVLAIQKFYNASENTPLGKERLALLAAFSKGADFDLHKVATHMDMLE